MIKYKRYERYKDSGVEWIGEIPEHWNNKKISWIFNIIGSGTTPSTSNLEYYDGDVPWVNTGDLNDGYLYETSKMITDLALKDYSTLKFYPIDTLLIAMYGATIGKLSITKIIATTNQACCALAQPKNVNIKFIFYWFLANRNHIIAMAYGGGQPNISQNLIKSLRINLPEKHEQNAIVNFLDQKTAVIDDLIADKEKLIELLQEKRQAIITEAVTKGLNPNVKMKDSGIKWIGEIPEHWEVKRIKYLATVNPSKSEVRHLPPEQEVTFIPMEKIVATGKVDYSITNTVENLIDGYTYFRDGDIIMAKVTPCFENGNIAIVNGLLNGIGFGTTELHVLRCNNKCYNKFLFYYLQSDVFKSKGISEMYGVAGLKRIPTDFVLNYKLGIPDYQEQKQITLYLDTIVDKINTLISDIQTQIDKLKEYRQSIISEAVTGKIKIYNS